MKSHVRKITIIFVVAIAVTSFYFICRMTLYYLHVYEAIFGADVLISDISVKELNPTNVTTEVVLCVDNPSCIDLIINRVEYRLYLNGKYLEGINLQRRQTISSNSSVLIMSEVFVSSNRVEIILDAVQANEWSWLVDGSLHIKNPIRNTVLISFNIRFVK